MKKIEILNEIMLENLKEEGLYEDTVIALYVDHFAVLSTQKQEQKIITV